MRPQTKELLSPWSLGPHRVTVEMFWFPHPEALQTPSFWVSVGGSVPQAPLIKSLVTGG